MSRIVTTRTTHTDVVPGTPVPPGGAARATVAPGAPVATDVASPRRAEPDPALEIGDLMGQVVRRLHRGTSAALAPLGLSRAQARVVRLLADGPMRMATIAERLCVVPRTVTDLVDGVEAAGLVARRPDPEDRRSTLVALTPDGHRLLDRLDVARREGAARTFGHLAADDQAALLRVLRRLSAAPAGSPGPDARPPGPEPAARPVPAASGSEPVARPEVPSR